MNRSTTEIAEIVREYGPFPGVDHVHGVTYDGERVWFAAGDTLNAFDPASGKILRSIDVAAHAGTAFDGQHLFQLAEDRIQKIDPKTGRVLATIPALGRRRLGTRVGRRDTLGGAVSGAEDPSNRSRNRVDSSHDQIRPLRDRRHLVDGELWHGTWEGGESDVRRVDPRTGEVLEKLEMPTEVGVSGLQSDGGDQFFCGGGRSGKVRTVRRRKRSSAR